MPGRVLHIVSRLNVGGPARHLLALAPALKDLGWDVAVACGPAEPEEGDLLEQAGAQGIDVRVLPSMYRPPGPADARAALDVIGLLRHEKPDVLHTHTAKAGAIGRIAAGLGRWRPPVVVHTFHGHVLDGYWPRPASGAIAGFERLAARLCDRITAVSPAVAQSLAAHRIATREEIAVVPVAVDPGRLATPSRAAARRALGVPQAAPVIVYVGRLAPIKRLDRLLAAAAAVASPDLHLLIAGTGPSAAALRARSRDSPLGPRLRWLGRMDEVGELYAAADLVALTSDNEGTPVSLIEAGLCGRPVVATDVGGVRDVVADGRTGLVVAPDSGSVAAAIERILGLPAELRDQWGASARERLAGRHHPNAVAAAHSSLYDELAARSGRRRR